jgi:hypothetical protein
MDTVEEIEMGSDDEGVDPFEYLGSLLQTEDGTGIAEVLNKLASHVENQNKILIKMVSILNTLSTLKTN